MAGERRLHAAQRVVGDVESQHFALGSQLRLAIKLGQVGDVDREACPRGLPLVQGTKKIELADRLVAFDVDDRIDSLIAASQQRPARVAHRVKRACTDQRLDGALVAHNLRDLIQEVLEGGEAPLFRAGSNDRFDDRASHVLNGIEPESDGLPVRSEIAH